MISLTFDTYKTQNLCFEPECTILGYKSYEAFVLIYWTDDFTYLHHVQDAKLVFEPECTILGYQSCEASILVHWTQNYVCECFG
jgi:hypothetical protein